MIYTLAERQHALTSGHGAVVLRWSLTLAASSRDRTIRSSQTGS